MAYLITWVRMSLFFAPVANMVLGSVRRDQEGIASGANNAIRELGGVFGIAVQHSHCGLRIGVEGPESIGQPGGGRAVDRVPPGRAVQEDGADRPRLLDPDRLLAHQDGGVETLAFRPGRKRRFTPPEMSVVSANLNCCSNRRSSWNPSPSGEGGCQLRAPVASAAAAGRRPEQ